MKLILVFLSIALTAISGFAESQAERDLKQLTDQRDKAVAAATEPINRRYKTSLEQLLQRAIQSKDLDAAVKIREALGQPAGLVPDTAKPKITKAAQTRRLDKSAWRETGNAWVSDLRFQGDKMIILPRNGGTTPVDFRVGNDGTINFTWDGKPDSITVSDDFATLTWGKYTFNKQ